MGLLSKARVGYKYSQWKRDLEMWCAAQMMEMKKQPFIMASYIAPAPSDDPHYKYKMYTYNIQRNDHRTLASFTEEMSIKFEDFANQCGYEKEDIILQITEAQRKEVEANIEELRIKQPILTLDDMIFLTTKFSRTPH